jgi:hypothetical protein
LDDLHRDEARGYAVPHDWHYGQCTGTNGEKIRLELVNIINMIGGYYAATIVTSETRQKFVLTGEDGWYAEPRFHLVCEGQFVKVRKPRKKGARQIDPAKLAAQQQDALQTAASRGRWQGIAEALGFETELAPLASTWRDEQLGRGWGWKPRLQAKRHAVAVANALWKLNIPMRMDHSAEARLIAEWGYTKLRMAT